MARLLPARARATPVCSAAGRTRLFYTMTEITAVHFQRCGWMPRPILDGRPFSVTVTRRLFRICA